MVTRLYFHAATDSTDGLPSAEQSTLTSNKNVDAQTVNKSMSTIIGTSQSVLTLTSIATFSAQNYYFTRFVSQPIGSQSSVAANTWTYNFAARENNAAANFPVGSTFGNVPINCYVWRPSTSTKVGTIFNGNSAATLNEAAPNVEAAHQTTFTGSVVNSTQDGDVIVFEIWFKVSQNNSVAYTDEFFYDGTTVNTTEGSTVSNHASYLETPEDLNFTGTPPVAVVEDRKRLKYIDLNEIGLMGEIIKI